MQIKLSKLNAESFDVRDEHDEDHVDRIAASFEEDGQWNAIKIRPGKENGDYEVIAGHNRVLAAKQLDWSEIEATVLDVDDQKADELSLTTNLLRQGMGKVEEGDVLLHMKEQYDMTNTELAEEVGKSRQWVEGRLKAAVNMHPKVSKAVENGNISFAIGTIISSVDQEEQPELLSVMTQCGITNSSEARSLRDRFGNDTIYTIGYQGREWDEFVNVLQENEIELLVDVRASSKSQYKPTFSKDSIRDSLEGTDIDYRHELELGVDKKLRQPYTNGHIGDTCFEDWYQWWVSKRTDSKGNLKIDLESIVDRLEATGKPALMCIERHAEPEGDQNHYCHRHYLADMMQSVTLDDRTAFPERTDL
jgi:ParB family chromosome partitioning protein